MKTIKKRSFFLKYPEVQLLEDGVKKYIFFNYRFSSIYNSYFLFAWNMLTIYSILTPNMPTMRTKNKWKHTPTFYQYEYNILLMYAIFNIMDSLHRVSNVYHLFPACYHPVFISFSYKSSSDLHQAWCHIMFKTSFKHSPNLLSIICPF